MIAERIDVSLMLLHQKIDFLELEVQEAEAHLEEERKLHANIQKVYYDKLENIRDEEEIKWSNVYKHKIEELENAKIQLTQERQNLSKENNVLKERIVRLQKNIESNGNKKGNLDPTAKQLLNSAEFTISKYKNLLKSGIKSRNDPGLESKKIPRLYIHMLNPRSSLRSVPNCLSGKENPQEIMLTNRKRVVSNASTANKRTGFGLSQR